MDDVVTSVKMSLMHTGSVGFGVVGKTQGLAEVGFGSPHSRSWGIFNRLKPIEPVCIRGVLILVKMMTVTIKITPPYLSSASYQGSWKIHRENKSKRSGSMEESTGNELLQFLDIRKTHRNK